MNNPILIITVPNSQGDSAVIYKGENFFSSLPRINETVSFNVNTPLHLDLTVELINYNIINNKLKHIILYLKGYENDLTSKTFYNKIKKTQKKNNIDIPLLIDDPDF